MRHDSSSRSRREHAAIGQVADRDDLAVEGNDRQLRPHPRQHTAFLQPLAQRSAMCRPGGPERSARWTRLDLERAREPRAAEALAVRRNRSSSRPSQPEIERQARLPRAWQPRAETRSQPPPHRADRGNDAPRRRASALRHTVGGGRHRVVPQRLESRSGGNRQVRRAQPGTQQPSLARWRQRAHRRQQQRARLPGRGKVGGRGSRVEFERLRRLRRHATHGPGGRRPALAQRRQDLEPQVVAIVASIEVGRILEPPESSGAAQSCSSPRVKSSNGRACQPRAKDATGCMPRDRAQATTTQTAATARFRTGHRHGARSAMPRRSATVPPARHTGPPWQQPRGSRPDPAAHRHGRSRSRCRTIARRTRCARTTAPRPGAARGRREWPARVAAGRPHCDRSPR